VLSAARPVNLAMLDAQNSRAATFFCHNANLPSARTAEPDFPGQFAPDSTMPVSAQYKELRHVIGFAIV
jgi:hypothetical protein